MLQKTSKSRDKSMKKAENRSQKTWGLFSMIEILPSRLDTGELNQSFKQSLNCNNNITLRSFLKSTSPAQHLRSRGSAMEPGTCFGLIWFLSFPNDSDPQLSSGLPETRWAPLGSNLWFPEPLWRQPSSAVRSFPPTLTQPGTFYCFFLLAVPCGPWDLSSPMRENPNLELGAWSSTTGPPGKFPYYFNIALLKSLFITKINIFFNFFFYIGA